MCLPQSHQPSGRLCSYRIASPRSLRGSRGEGHVARSFAGGPGGQWSNLHHASRGVAQRHGPRLTLVGIHMDTTRRSLVRFRSGKHRGEEEGPVGVISVRHRECGQRLEDDVGGTTTTTTTTTTTSTSTTRKRGRIVTCGVAEPFAGGYDSSRDGLGWWGAGAIARGARRRGRIRPGVAFPPVPTDEGRQRIEECEPTGGFEGVDGDANTCGKTAGFGDGCIGAHVETGGGGGGREEGAEETEEEEVGRERERVLDYEDTWKKIYI